MISGLLIVTSPVLTGCFNGLAATTTVQATQPTGSGAYVSVGDVRVQNVLLVAGPIEGATSGGQPFIAESITLIGRVFNDADQPDAIMGITIDGNAAQFTVPSGATDALVIPALGSLPLSFPEGGPLISGAFGENQVAVSTYVPVQMMFERAGIVEFEALVVPQSGIYADVPLS